MRRSQRGADDVASQASYLHRPFSALRGRSNRRRFAAKLETLCGAKRYLCDGGLLTGLQQFDAGSGRVGIIETPARLFKFFTVQDHATALANEGRVRIGTLFEFRRTEGWDLARGDAQEGTYRITLESAIPEFITLENAPWYLVPIIEQLGMPIQSSGGTLTAEGTYSDAYIYCTTARNTDVPREYGTFAVEIFDVPGFFVALTRHLIDELRMARIEPSAFVAPCLYGSRSVTSTSAQTEIQLPPVAFLKPAARAAEQEVRAVWHPSASGTLAPIMTTCSGLVQCCRLVAGQGAA